MKFRPQASANAPVFLLSPARSYSTVSLALLAGHPQIFGFPEMLLFTTETVEELLVPTHQSTRGRPSWITERRVSGICRAVAEIHDGSQNEIAINRARMWLEAHADWDTERLMRYLLDRVSPRIGLEKSPETATEKALQRCIRAFPDARFIHLTRHPVQTQRSMYEHMEWRDRDKSEVTKRVDYASSWYLSHRSIMRHLDALPRDKWIRVRAEDLLRDPPQVLPLVYDWLGLDHDEAVVAASQQTERWPFATRGETGNLYGGDPKFMHSPRLRRIAAPEAVAFPDEWGLSDEMCRRMAALALTLGYA